MIGKLLSKMNGLKKTITKRTKIFPHGNTACEVSEKYKDQLDRLLEIRIFIIYCRFYFIKFYSFYNLLYY